VYDKTKDQKPCRFILLVTTAEHGGRNWTRLLKIQKTESMGCTFFQKNQTSKENTCQREIHKDRLIQTSKAQSTA